MHHSHRAPAVRLIRLVIGFAAAALTSSIDGAQLTIIQARVVARDDATFPIRGARVELVGSSARADPVFTDGRGRFALGAPVPFTLRITKAGYAPAIVDGRQTAGELEVRLTRGAVVTGRVADEFGSRLAARWFVHAG